MSTPEIGSFTLTKRDFGARAEGVCLTQELFHIPVPKTGHIVGIHAAIWERNQDPVHQNPIFPEHLPNTHHEQRKEQLVIMSGFTSSAQEWAFAYPSFGQYWPTVVGLDHPESPSASISPAEKPLNQDTFANSGYVELRAIEKLIQKGTLQPGVTVLGYSTGGAVMLEAAAQDVREAKETGRERYIKNIILVNSAGLQNQPSYKNMAMGVGASMKPYMEEYLVDVRKRFQRLFQRFVDRIPAPQQQGYTTDNPISFSQFLEKMRFALRNPAWKQIRIPNLGFEMMEYIAGKLPMRDFMAHFHRVWPNPGPELPHFLPYSPSIQAIEQLVSTDSTAQARQALNTTTVELFFGVNDKGVPPEGFLTDVDKDHLSHVTFGNHDRTAMVSLNRNIVARYNEHRMQKGLPVVTLATFPKRDQKMLYTPEAMLTMKRAELAQEMIIRNVKALFPEGNSVHVHLAETNHISPRSYVPDLLALQIAKILNRHDLQNKDNG